LKAYKNINTGKVVTAVEFKKGFAHFCADGIIDIMDSKKFLANYAEVKQQEVLK